MVEAASNKLVIPHHFIDRERDILLRLERNDFLDLFLVDGGQIDETRKNRLRGQCVVHKTAFDVQLGQHLAQSDRHLRSPDFFSRGFDWNLAQSIAEQDQPAMGLHAKFCQADSLRSKIETDDARRDSHLLKAPSSKLQIPNKSRTAILKSDQCNTVPCGHW